MLDFIGNHHSFLHKPQALAQLGTSYKQLAEFARKVESRRLELPPGCFINYDIELIDFLKSLDSDGTAKDYAALKDGLGRRPTLAEFYRCGANLGRMRREYGSWFELVHAMEDLDSDEAPILAAHRDFLHELETTAMTRSFKMVLLEALQELDGWSVAPSLPALAERSWQVLQRRRPLLADLSDTLGDAADGTNASWQRYWRDNPVKAWTGGNQPATAKTFFRIREQPLEPTFEPTSTFDVAAEHRERFAALVQELVDYRLAAYEVRRTADAPPDQSRRPPLPRPLDRRPHLPLAKPERHHARQQARARDHRA